jgi:hypothetical protein
MMHVIDQERHIHHYGRQHLEVACDRMKDHKCLANSMELQVSCVAHTALIYRLRQSLGRAFSCLFCRCCLYLIDCGELCLGSTFSLLFLGIGVR